MKPFVVFPLLILSFLIQVSAQPSIDFSSLQFHSTFEREAFANVSKSGSDSAAYEALLLAVNSESNIAVLQNARKVIADLVAQIERRKIAGMNFKKASKIIFTVVHDQLLKRYDLHAQFADLFNGGIYNCATASALFAILLEHFNLPYAIIEMPEHVNILVDPGHENIVLESTDPQMGLKTLNKKEIVNALVQAKMVAEAEVAGKSPDEVYDLYFQESERQISLPQLAGVLYYNASLSKYEVEQDELALALIEKSLWLHPTKPREQFQRLLLLHLTAKANYENPESFKPHFALLRYENEINREEIFQILNWSLQEIARKYLIETANPEKYQAFYDYFLKSLDKEDDLSKEIMYTHHYKKAHYWDLRFDMKQSFAHCDSAYLLKPDNLDLQYNISRLVFRSLNNLIQQKDKFKTNLESYTTKYPFILNNPDIQLICLFQISSEVYDHFEDNNEVKGFETFRKMEQSIEAIVERNLYFDLAIGNAYGSISSYYVRSGDYQKAQEWLEKGFVLAPESEELKRKQEAMDEYFDYQELLKKTKSSNKKN